MITLIVILLASIILALGAMLKGAISTEGIDSLEWRYREERGSFL